MMQMREMSVFCCGDCTVNVNVHINSDHLVSVKHINVTLAYPCEKFWLHALGKICRVYFVRILLGTKSESDANLSGASYRSSTSPGTWNDSYAAQRNAAPPAETTDSQ